MPRDGQSEHGDRHRRWNAEERAAVFSARRVVDPEGRRWIVHHEDEESFLDFLPQPLPEILLLTRRVQKRAKSAIYADRADGSSHRIALGQHASVREAMDRVASAIENGTPLPATIDS